MFGFPLAFFIKIATAYITHITLFIVLATFLANAQSINIFGKPNVFKMPRKGVSKQRLYKPKYSFHFIDYMILTIYSNLKTIQQIFYKVTMNICYQNIMKKPYLLLQTFHKKR